MRGMDTPKSEFGCEYGADKPHLALSESTDLHSYPWLQEDPDERWSICKIMEER